ncbi:hypothetical protein ACPOLB_25000 [Rubrivivax sp. RP6-9]|uniref:hypothetical protein n=1 Tax=Rubrivivax sp. RP6-9 TaxID=3415750 RepID=UPI003CC67059
MPRTRASPPQRPQRDLPEQQPQPAHAPDNPGHVHPTDAAPVRPEVGPRRAKAPRSGPGLALPHERDTSPEPDATGPDPVILQAKRDLDAGLVDTDMHATPGQDATLRARLVPGPGGKPPSGR